MILSIVIVIKPDLEQILLMNRLQRIIFLRLLNIDFATSMFEGVK